MKMDYKEFIKQHKFEVVAHDYNSPLFYNYIWTGNWGSYPAVHGISSPVFGTISTKNQVEYYGDLSSWARPHEEMREKILKDNNLLEKIIDKTMELCEDMNEWSEKNIFNKDLTKISNKELIELVKEVIEKEKMVTTYGTVMPLLDFQGFSFVEGNLVKFLRSKTSGEEEFDKYYEVFTEPINNSFAQDQEEDLLALMNNFYGDKKWVADIKLKNLEEIEKLYPDFYNDLQSHTKKHSWVYYVYVGPAFTEQDFLDFIRGYLEQEVDPGKKLDKMKAKSEEIKKLKEEYIEKLNPDDFHKKIIYLTGKMVWAKPRRKDYQSKTLYHAEKLLREIAKRLYVSLNQVRSIPLNDFKKYLLDGAEVDLDKINSIYNFHICIPAEDGSTPILYGKEAEDFSNQIKRTKVEADKNLNEIKGERACGGRAKGVVKIINLSEDMQKMNQGDILVSSATTPSIVAAMKKAAAIVTDEGGLTCHASIVSRELGTPCVVGTKFITQVVNDGDEVEVDANRGIVKIIKRLK